MLNKNKNNKGFTLVEILVVIAIIAILAVVAVPALFKNIEKAKISELEADINAIRSAALSYYADTSGDTPNSEGITLIKEDGKIKILEPLLPPTIVEGEYTSTIEEEKRFISKIEGLSMPFGNMYCIRKVGGKNENNDPSIQLIIENHNISNSGLEKLENDIGEERIISKTDTSLQIYLINKL